MRRSHRVSIVVVLLAVVGVACSSDDDTNSGGSGSTSGDTRTLTVLAAASLTNAFTDLAEEFEAENAGVEVEVSFGASSELVAQIEEGAPADVFASADEANVEKVVAAGEADGEAVPFARNRLEIAVEPGNPEGIRELSDLAREDLVVVLCAPEVPCGKFADQVLDAADVTVEPASREESVSSTLGKVELGEADAAIVYASDVATSGDVDGVVIPDELNVVTTLPMVRLAASQSPELAQQWIDFVVSREQQLVDEYGFLAL